MDRFSFMEFSFLLVLVPILLVLILLFFFVILFYQGWPVFFISRRVGANASTFKVLKFRTMVRSAPLVESAAASESLLTPLGRHLRRLSIDEIPQVLNVIFGQMALVGPRPCLESQCDLLRERNKVLDDSVKPGITGLAQVRGRDNLTVAQKVRYERFYEDKKSVRLYVFVLCQTVGSIIRREGT